MAFEVKGMEEVMKQLEDAADLDRLAPKMIQAAAPNVAENLKKNIHAAANRGYATGELAKAVHTTKVKKNDYGYFAAVGATGKDEKGVRNGEKLAYLEYGTAKQNPHPVMAKTVNESEATSLAKMQEVFNQEIGL